MILLDTHVLLWSRLDDPRLGPEARATITRHWALGEVAVSSVSFWEIGMRIRKGRLTIDAELDGWRRNLLASGLVELSVDGDIAIRAGLLRHLHGDPADRIIVATALDGHRLVTADAAILAWPRDLARLDART